MNQPKDRFQLSAEQKVDFWRAALGPRLPQQTFGPAESALQKVMVTITPWGESSLFRDNNHR